MAIPTVMLTRYGDETSGVTCQALMDTQTFIATAGQTTFTLTNAPSGDIVFSRNGMVISDAAASVTGTTVTYVPANNSNQAMVAGDRVEIAYVYNVCTGGAAPTIVDGSETKVIAGTGATVTGAGTAGNPYVINGTPTNIQFRAYFVGGSGSTGFFTPTAWTTVHNTNPTAWAAATATFTAPVSGYYSVSGVISASGTWAVSDFLNLTLLKNGVSNTVWQIRAPAAGAYTLFVNGSSVIFLATGDTLAFRTSSSKTYSLNTTAGLNDFTISLVQ